MREGPRQRLQRPFPREAHQPEKEIDDLENGDRFDGAVEARRQKVPEDFGPEEAFDGGADLPWISRSMVSVSFVRFDEKKRRLTGCR